MKNPTTALVALYFLLLQFTMFLAHASDQIQIPARHMLGSYKEANPDDERLTTVANFALTTFLAGGSSRAYSFSALLGGSEGDTSKTESGVFVKIINAQQQVVAGMNYRLMLGMFQGEDCLGAFKVTVYDRFGDMSVTNWGDEVSCEEAQTSFEEAS